MAVFDLEAILRLNDKDYTSKLQQASGNAKSFGSKAKSAMKTASKAFMGVTTAVSGASVALYGVAKKSADASDRVDKMSQKIGISREAYQELDFILSQSGASVDSLRAGMKTLTNQMTEASNGTEKSAGYFEELGVSVTDTEGNLRSQEEVLYDVMSALQDMDNQTEKAQLANKLLGRSGADLMPLLNGEAGSIEAMKDQAHELGLVLSDETIDAGVQFTDTIDQLKRSFGSVVTQVGAEVMPAILGFVDYIIAHMPEIQSTLQIVFGAVQKVVKKVVGVLKTALLPIFEAIVGFVSDHWTEIQTAFETVFSAIETVVQTVIDIASDLYDKFVEIADYVVDTFQPVWEDLKELWETIIEALQPVIDKVVEIKGKLEDYVTSGEASEDATNAIKTAIDLLADAIDGIITGLTDFIEWLSSGSETADLFISAIAGITTAIVGFKLATIASTIAGNAELAVLALQVGALDAVAVAQGALNAVMNANPIGIIIALIAGLVTAIVVLWKKNEGFRDAIKSIWRVIKNVFKNAWEFIKGVWEGVVDFFQGVWDGITAVFDGVVDWFKGVFQDAYDAVTGVFDKITDFFSDLWDDITDLFEDVGTTVGDTVGEAFKTVINSILGFAEDTINGFLKAINKAIKVINKIPKVSISELDLLEIPKLAKGAVIQPNNPFTAVLGDQTSGVNIETPLSTMVDAFNTALDARTGTNESEVLLRAIYNYLEDMNIKSSIQDAVEGLEFKADNRELARMVKKYA